MISNPNVKTINFPEVFKSVKAGLNLASGFADAAEIAAIMKSKKGMVPMFFALLVYKLKDMAREKALSAAKDAIVQNGDYAADFIKSNPEKREKIAEAINQIEAKLAESGYDAKEIVRQSGIRAALGSAQEIELEFGEGGINALAAKNDPREFAAVDATSLMSMGSYGSRILDEAIQYGARNTIPIGVFNEHIREKEMLNGIDRVEEEIEAERRHAPSPGM